MNLIVSIHVPSILTFGTLLVICLVKFSVNFLSIKVTDEEAASLKARIGIRMNPIYPQIARLLTHNDLTAEMVDLAIAKLQYVVKEFGQTEE